MMPLSLYLAAGAAIAGFLGGFYLQGLRWDASLLKTEQARYSAVVRVRQTDADLQRIATARGAATETQLQFQREKANAIQTAIAQRLASLPVCAVPGDVVGLLNAAAGRDPNPTSAGSAGQPGSPLAPADPSRRPDGQPVDVAAGTPGASTAAHELAICARNYAEVCIPNAIERDALRELYNQVKERINRPP